jgi:hypothetical protein
MSIKIHRQLLSFWGEDTVDLSTLHGWVRKSCDCGGNVDLNNQLQSGKPVSATHLCEQTECDKIIQKNQISQKACFSPCQ